MSAKKEHFLFKKVSLFAKIIFNRATDRFLPPLSLSFRLAEPLPILLAYSMRYDSHPPHTSRSFQFFLLLRDNFRSHHQAVRMSGYGSKCNSAKPGFCGLIPRIY